MNGWRFLPFFAAGLLLAAFAPAAVAATTWYASPTGSGEACTEATPCKAEKAVEKAQAGDSVVLASGNYPLLASLSMGKAIDLGGRPGGPAPVLETANGKTVVVSISAKATIHDLWLQGTGGLILSSGVAERISVSYTGTSSACSLYVDTTLRDSVCWAHAGGPGANAISTNGPSGTIVLRNVTAVSDASSATAIYGSASSGVLNIQAFNLIARGHNHPDVETVPGGSSTVNFTLTHSIFQTSEGDPPNGTIAAPGTNGNLTAAASFVDAAAGDFRPALGSPSIDAGLTEAANGPLALGGEARALGVCVGGSGITDIGAYEFVPTVACPAPPAPAPTPPSNAIKLGKLAKNAKKGTATLQVTVPGAGQLTLSGKGVKKVARSAKGAAKLRLPITPVGSAKKKLATAGSAKLSLTLKFVPTGGTAGKRTKSVKLTELLR